MSAVHRARVKKSWKEAASLILTTGSFRYARQPLRRTATSRLKAPMCLEGIEEDKSLELLFVQRGRKSEFMSDAYAWPGGHLDKADYFPKWMDLFQECTAPDKHPFSPILELNHSRLPIYNEITGTPVPGEIAFRICAIRELFEEAGILLARDQNDVPGILDFLPGSFSPAVKVLPVSSREEWRKRVHSNAAEFQTMCRELQCVPDVWSLIEWCEWLGPNYGGRRYDIMFYICFCENKPLAFPDNLEVTDVQWLNHSLALQEYTSGKTILVPQLFPELYLLSSFDSAPCLHSYALYESIYGYSYRTGLRIRTKDGNIVAAGKSDDLFPVEGDVTECPVGTLHHPQSPILRDKVPLYVASSSQCEYECPTHTAAELHQLSKTMQRVQYCNLPRDGKIIDNVTPNRIAEHMQRYACAEGLSFPKSQL